MRPITLRMSRTVHDLVAECAEADGVSAAQWIREAILARVVFQRVLADPTLSRDIERLIRELREEGLIG